MRLRKGTGKERSRKQGRTSSFLPAVPEPAQACLHNSGWAGPDKTLSAPVKHQGHLHIPQGHQDASRKEHLALETPLQKGWAPEAGQAMSPGDPDLGAHVVGQGPGV